MDISIVMNLAPFVDTTLLNRILVTSISAVGVATSPGYSILSLPTVNLVLFLSFFLWLETAQKLPVRHVFSLIVWYVISSYECDRVSWFFMYPPTPFSSCLNSFTEDVIQFFLFFGFLISCL